MSAPVSAPICQRASSQCTRYDALFMCAYTSVSSSSEQRAAYTWGTRMPRPGVAEPARMSPVAMAPATRGTCDSIAVAAAQPARSQSRSRDFLARSPRHVALARLHSRRPGGTGAFIIVPCNRCIRAAHPRVPPVGTG